MDKEGKLSAAYIPILNQVDVAILQMCLNAIEHSKILVKTWLQNYMFAGQFYAEQRASMIADKLSEHRAFLSHGRPLGIRQAQELGLVVGDLKDAPELQAKIWELYCRIELLFDGTPWVKVFVSKNYMVGKLVPRVVEIPVRQPAPPGASPQVPSEPAPSDKEAKRGKGRKRRR